MSYGFYFDMTSCIGCRTCQIACKDKNDLAVGTLFRHVGTFETGEFPAVGFYHHSSTCNHCEQPACFGVCPVGAIAKDPDTGIVTVDGETCTGCGACVEACPYSVPQYVESQKIVRKCDMCSDLLENGGRPACVDACVMRCLAWGDFDELAAKHPDAVTKTALFPDDGTGPHFLIDPKGAALESTFAQKFI